MNELLPNEILCLIFSHLPLSDLFNTLKLTNKRFYCLVNSMRFEELIFANFSECVYKNSWYHSNRPTNVQNIIYADYLDLAIRSSSFKSSFSNLKSLKIDFGFLYYDMYFDVEQLNSFDKLEHLQFDNFYLRLNRNACLRLPNLRVLRVFLGFPTKQLQIDAARLEVLCCNLLRTKLTHPLSIMLLQQVSQEIRDLRKFANLEIYKSTVSAYEGEEFDNDILFKLPDNLRQLHFEHYHFDDLKDFVRAFFRDRHRLNRLGLKLFFNGLELVNDRPFADYRPERLLEFHQNNYQRLISLPWYEEVNFEQLTEAYRPIPTNFHSKYTNIQKVSAGKIENQREFTCFLKACNQLSFLMLLKLSMFDQQFLDELPKLRSSLFRLELREEFDIQIDFRFVGEFRVMAALITDQHLPIRLALDLFETVKFLNFLSFKNGRKNVEIAKFSRKKLVFGLKYGTGEWNFNDFPSLTRFVSSNLANQNQVE